MSESAQDDSVRNTVAVRLSTHASHSEKLGEFLTSRGWTDARRFLPKDDDELNDRLCRGEFATVVFSAPEDVMSMIWSGHGDVCQWNAKQHGAHFEVCFAFAANQEANWYNTLRRVEVSFVNWERTRRRRQVIAGCILTAVALAAMGLLFWTRG